MLSPVDQYRKLKRQAKRLMMSGDVERYLFMLRELHDLRALQSGRFA